MGVYFKVSGLKTLKTSITEARARLKNPRVANLAAVIELEKWTLKNFRADGKLHEDVKYFWPGLKASTVARRRRGKGRGQPKILRDTGRLMGAFKHSATEEYGVLENRTHYAAYHESGTKKLPQRKIFPTKPHGTDIVLPIYRDFVKKSVMGLK